MIISGEQPGSSGKTRRHNVDIASESMRVTLSLSPGRSGDRKKVLERARRMLAVALEEEKRRVSEKSSSQVVEARPGCGAWWLF